MFQTPLFGGYASSVATLPAERSPTGKRITIATAVTMRENAYPDWNAGLPNWANELTKTMAARLVPGNPPPPFH